MDFDWLQLVSWIANTINYAVLRTTQHCPNKLFFGASILPLADDFHCVLGSKLSEVTDDQAVAFTIWLFQCIKTIHKDAAANEKVYLG